MVGSDDGTESYVVEIIRSDKAMHLLDSLHEQRVSAPNDTITMPVKELAHRLASRGEPHDHVPQAQVSVQKQWLEDGWLERMADLHLIGYDEETAAVAATPATTLQWMIIQPRMSFREPEEIASRASWVAARVEEWGVL